MTTVTPPGLAVRHGRADVGGLRMHYVEQGEGPLVLLLHGFPEMWWSWRYQIPALAAAGFRVVAPDLRGYAGTEAKPPYDLDTLRDDVAGLLDHLGAENATVIGHDWGGAVAWHLAGTRPERCARLVVMNCPHPAVFLRAVARRPRQLRRSWYMLFFQIPWLPERLLAARGGEGAVRAIRAHAVDRTRFGRDELAPFAEAIREPGRATAMLGWYRAAARSWLRAARVGYVGRSRPRAIVAPTLLLWGLDDRALGFDDVVPGTERHVPGIEIQTIARCGHFVQQERPDEVNARVLEFLRRTAP